jgi:predicted DNA-binding transcriptional regulator YafY
MAGGRMLLDRQGIFMATTRLGKARPSGEPSGSTERKIRILLELIRNKFVRLSRLADEYDTSERSLLRDLQELRKIGKRAGFQLSEKTENDRVRLISFDSRPTAIDKSGRALRSLIRDAAHALGKPVEAQLESLEAEETPGERRFLHFLTPTLREGSRVAETYKELEAAWANNARVTFRYSGKERRLEPACVFVRSGRYYLLGRDPNSRAWKYYALDAIEPPIKRAGSFTPQPIPAKYQHDDALGFFKGAGEERVSVWISPAIAPSATSRVWQQQQEIEMHEDGSATLTFTVNDAGEVIRWALGFGAEAKVVAPESAVDMARNIAQEIAGKYE